MHILSNFGSYSSYTFYLGRFYTPSLPRKEVPPFLHDVRRKLGFWNFRQFARNDADFALVSVEVFCQRFLGCPWWFVFRTDFCRQALSDM